jgi:hypothetical protein
MFFFNGLLVGPSGSELPTEFGAATTGSVCPVRTHSSSYAKSLCSPNAIEPRKTHLGNGLRRMRRNTLRQVEAD